MRPQRGRLRVNEVREEGTRFRVIPHTKEKEALISEQKKQCVLFVLKTKTDVVESTYAGNV